MTIKMHIADTSRLSFELHKY